MQYRNFGEKIDFKPSALGFGAMRLPVIDGKHDIIDEKKSIKMIRYSIDKGLNYIDTAWPYHGRNSEIVVGKAIKNGYRDKIKIATKLPSWEIKKPEDMDKYLNEQLAKLGVKQIDFYLLHTLNKDFWNNLLKHDVFSWIRKIKDEGKINYIGFSFHGRIDTFKKIVDAYEWDFCQIQYNYLNEKHQAGLEGLKYASSRGLGIVIMEPLLGGRLAERQPEQIQQIFDSSSIERTNADWALQWLWNQAEVSLVLSGMSNLQQVKENINSALNSGINSLNEEELKIIKKVVSKYKDINPVNCTGCEYCMPCPNGVSIPEIISIYNTAHIYNQYKENKKRYEQMDEKNKASACIDCHICETKCPQNLNISKIMDRIEDYF